MTQKAKPLSPGSNYPSTKNIQRQSSGFGNFVQKFQKARRDDSICRSDRFGAPRSSETGRPERERRTHPFPLKSPRHARAHAPLLAQASGKSKYGMPIFLPNGSINPKYLAAERADMAAQAKRSVTAEAGKRAKMKKAGTYELGDFIKKKIGNVGSGKEYYQSGR